MNSEKQNAAPIANRFSPREVIGRLIDSYHPVAEKNQSHFSNEVPESYVAEADKNVFATLLGSILYLSARCTSNDCIRVSANESDDTMMICVKSSGPQSSDKSLPAMQHFQLLAEKLGAVINMLPGKNSAGFIFSMPCVKPIQKPLNRLNLVA